jgi:hypothetical protein
MCAPGFIKAEYNKDDPSTWKHWQTAEQKSTEEGRMTNPFASDDGRYDSLSGQQWSVQTQRGGQWENLNEKMRYAPGHLSYAMDQIDKEWDHKAELERIKASSQTSLVAGSGGSGRGYSSSSRSGRGSASTSSGLGITTGDIINNRGAT